MWEVWKSNLFEILNRIAFIFFWNTIIFLSTILSNRYNSDFTARILRGVRIAARLEFKFTKDLAVSLKELSFSVLRLDKVFTLHILLCICSIMLYTHTVSLNAAGKDPYGDELYVGLWIRWSFFKVTMEVWSFRDTPTPTSTHTISILAQILWLFLWYTS